jgi:hypothetical protein
MWYACDGVLGELIAAGKGGHGSISQAARHRHAAVLVDDSCYVAVVVYEDVLEIEIVVAKDEFPFQG